MREKTLYEYAERHPRARALAGRSVAYAVPLPGDPDCVVVRHNRHGGVLAPLTGDLFRPPTRAPLELQISERLRRLGVPTPRVVAYATYAAVAGFQRADVATLEVSDSADLSAALMSDDAKVRMRGLRAAANLIAALDRARVRHHDLNVKNILLRAPLGDTVEALVLDVDRVEFASDRHSVLEANLARLLRSAHKWQSRHGARVTESELAEFASWVRARSSVHVTTLS
jgi:3-deoxy-D-manno-octulosonic acid kinase